MIAVIKTGGKQYSVKAGQVLKVEKLQGKKGDNISLNKVLVLSDSSKQTFGNPLIEGASVNAKILDQIRGDKVIVFKKRQRQNYRLTQGHRQYLTVLRIETISFDGKKSTATPVVKKNLKTESKETQKKVETKEAKPTKKKNVTKKTLNKASPAKKKSVKKTVKKTTKSKEDK